VIQIIKCILHSVYACRRLERLSEGTSETQHGRWWEVVSESSISNQVDYALDLDINYFICTLRYISSHPRLVHLLASKMALPLARTSARTAWTSRFFGLGLTLTPASSGATLKLTEKLSALPSLKTLLELFPPIVLAVPKKKTSPSKKRMRSANKGLKDKTSACPSPYNRSS
jgi:hypothetical protein